MGLIDNLSRPNVPVLTGDGVVLRLPRRSDYPAWRALREESRAFLTPWEPVWTDDELSWPAFRRRIARYNHEAREACGYSFFVFDRAGTTLLGGITVGHIRRGVAQSATLGYWMGERYAGQGHMRRAVEAVKLFAFEIEGLHRIEAACLPSNQRSIRLLERCGFSREGRLRGYLKIAGKWEDHCLYALLVEEWSRSAATAPARRPAAIFGRQDG
ncbi:GNAT family protein [Aurantimonas sp. 22II-16-19i]|uniref:GNAT family N-acetyltransferase n=1 Tax=Aurantimonas sp. 22II-16-19i TaxID=1317114 RepID=UPI0009F7A2C7|nr:GNAT family protein [Aurantimonas sp. 22II-16-19i]ORE97428.1 N-acetyltransferase GCN5 [Aurantimonas sp. 22II-16-19i]